MIKKFNGNLRQSRKDLGNDSQNNSINQRRLSGKNSNDDAEDRNPSPAKKLRTVLLKDVDDEMDDCQREMDEEAENGKSINQRRGVLSFQIK